MQSHVAKLAKVLPEDLRRELIEARREHGWTQAELGRRLGLPQMHISGIETGKVVPRYDTLLEIVRVLDRDLLIVPRSLVPAIQALIRDHRTGPAEEAEQPLYASDEAEDRDDEA
jgi:HTH-type transcriptional regulator/antitoxin HipB